MSYNDMEINMEQFLAITEKLALTPFEKKYGEKNYEYEYTNGRFTLYINIQIPKGKKKGSYFYTVKGL